MQLADILHHLTPLSSIYDTLNKPRLRTHFGPIKAALKSWLVSITSFCVHVNTPHCMGHRSKLACGCTCPYQHLTNSIQHLQLFHFCLIELLYSMLSMMALLGFHQFRLPVSQLLAIPQRPFHQLHHQDLFFHPIFTIIPSQSCLLGFLDYSLGRLLSAYLPEMR